MDHHMTIVRVLTLSVTLASIFTVLVVTVLKVIRQAAFYGGKTALLISGALSVLFLVALSEYLVGPSGAYHTAVSDSVVKAASHSLLPGVALGVAAAVLLSQVLLLASKTSPDEKPDRPVVKLKSPGRPKKEKAPEKESKKVTKPVVSTS